MAVRTVTLPVQLYPSWLSGQSPYQYSCSLHGCQNSHLTITAVAFMTVRTGGTQPRGSVTLVVTTLALVHHTGLVTGCSIVASHTVCNTGTDRYSYLYVSHYTRGSCDLAMHCMSVCLCMTSGVRIWFQTATRSKVKRSTVWTHIENKFW